MCLPFRSTYYRRPLPLERSRQKFNFAWACIFNIILIPLAAGVFYPLGNTRLPPVWAALAMALSSTS